MIFHKSFPKQTEMNQLEMEFKKIYSKYPERELDLPHPPAYFENTLKQAAAATNELSSSLLLDSQLNEHLFFRSNFDTELYRHLRYLPASWHSHTFFEIVCVIEGTCTNYILSQKLEMHPGDICIIAPDTRHAISAFSDDCIIINILLRTSTFESAFFDVLSENDVLSVFFMRTLYHSKTHPYLLFKTGYDQELMDYVLYAYQEFLGNHQYKARFLNNIVSAFFIILLRNHESKLIVPEIDTEGKDENVIFILKYIQANYCTVTLKELSGFFHYSERQIQRIVKDATGVSFSENIQKLKMQQTARLLHNPDLSIAAIAEELGYSDIGNFRNIFKKYFHMTPAEYRNGLS